MICTGTSPDDCRDLCIRLEEAKVDVVDLSGGTFEGRAFEHKKDSTVSTETYLSVPSYPANLLFLHHHQKAREAYFIEFAEMIRPHLKKTKVYVTGGFRTASGMVRAIETNACHGVGLGRPLSAEPYFCRDIISGKISGAIENLVPLPQNTQASGTQLHQIGFGDPTISDWSEEGEVQRWMKAYEEETERNIKLLPKIQSSGFPHLRAEAGFEYLR